MTGQDGPAREPREEQLVDGQPRDPYGLGPNARRSVGGYFPAATGRPAEDPARSSGEDGRERYAVALVVPSCVEHAVPWELAVPRATATTACGVQARVAEISGTRLIWERGRMMCQECAAVVTGRRPPRQIGPTS
ncbi:hypothetical protein Skr01_33700 [Sphaerisporangium krabiense]|uniref:Uncharacterized protein n=1 Tax=Sphaerisporangium krabiense TaxID=763782 RepID=A0A7W8Z2Q5_9ACTN|nr:hypothetical protein [Sphaerisporangium krabiense]MBB5626367.1 hypothetical protein [Sphaerisporangium krabiense]GII63285.1 hypothetical protein Skr01_33700 [Sphaerisporangium krabiense]